MVGIKFCFFPQVCEGMPTMLKCIASTLSPSPDNDSYFGQELNYTVIMDNAGGPDITQPSLRLVLRPNPNFTGILEMDRTIPLGSNPIITIIVGLNGKG